VITALTRTPGSIQLVIRGIQNPPVCAMAVGPATARVDVGYLAPGEYQLRFVLNGAAIESRLLVTSDAYRVVGGNARGLTVDHARLVALLTDVGRRNLGTAYAQIETGNGAALRSWMLAGPPLRSMTAQRVGARGAAAQLRSGRLSRR